MNHDLVQYIDPNSINEPNFTTPITKAGEEYNSKTVYRFAVR